MADLLTDAVEAYLDAATGPDLVDRGAAIGDAVAIVCAVIDADARHSASEKAAIRRSFGDRLGVDLPSGDTDLSTWISGHAARASELPTGVVAAARQATNDRPHPGWTTYRAAMDVAHAAAALDAFAGGTELDRINRLRRELLELLDTEAVPRPAPTIPTPAEVIRRVRDAITGDKATGEGPAPEEADDRPATERRDPEEVLAELDRLVGLEPVKRHLRQLGDLLKVRRLRKDHGLANPGRSEHLVFVGNPGTGKTTVARVVAELYAAYGLLEKGHLVEVDRSGLVAEYVGQTAIKTVGRCEEAYGGVLLVDEAYSLVRGGEKDFGKEAIDALVKQMEDHREELVLIVAGYPEPMAEFLSANPGLSSRFPNVVPFPDYDDQELLQILELIAADNDYLLDDDAREYAVRVFAAQHRGPTFGNGRDARNLFETALATHAARVSQIESPTEDELYVLTVADLADAADQVHGSAPPIDPPANPANPTKPDAPEPPVSSPDHPDGEA